MIVELYKSENKELMQMAEAVDRAFNGTGHYLQNRCLATCIVLSHVLERDDYLCEFFAGGVDAMSEKLRRAAIEKQSFAFTPEEAEVLGVSGARMVGIRANIPPANAAENSLFGHVSLIARKGNKTYFIDPTSYQLTRTIAAHGWELPAPKILVLDAPNKLFDTVARLNAQNWVKANKTTVEIEYNYKAGGCVLYQYTRLKQLEEIRKAKDPVLSLERYADVLARLGSAVR